jgi:hypothetical protein
LNRSLESWMSDLRPVLDFDRVVDLWLLGVFTSLGFTCRHIAHRFESDPQGIVEQVGVTLRGLDLCMAEVRSRPSAGRHAMVRTEARVAVSVGCEKGRADAVIGTSRASYAARRARHSGRRSMAYPSLALLPQVAAACFGTRRVSRCCPKMWMSPMSQLNGECRARM